MPLNTESVLHQALQKKSTPQSRMGIKLAYQ